MYMDSQHRVEQTFPIPLNTIPLLFVNICELFCIVFVLSRETDHPTEAVQVTLDQSAVSVMQEMRRMRLGANCMRLIQKRLPLTTNVWYVFVFPSLGPNTNI